MFMYYTAQINFHILSGIFLNKLEDFNMFPALSFSTKLTQVNHEETVLWQYGFLSISELTIEVEKLVGKMN